MLDCVKFEFRYSAALRGVSRGPESHGLNFQGVARLGYTAQVALITVPVLVTSVVAIHYIRKRNRRRAKLLGSTPPAVQEPDTSVVSATIVLTSLPQQVLERTLELLPPNMARSIILVLGEMPPIANETIATERKRWLSLFDPPRRDMVGIENEDPTQIAAATVRLVLEDSA